MFIVAAMLLLSSVLMALAWLGHLKFKQHGFFVAVMASWLLVLPEYLLNVSAIRYGHGTFSAAQMAAFNLSSGVVCVALVARYYLGEELANHQVLGFVLMTVAMALIMYKAPT